MRTSVRFLKLLFAGVATVLFVASLATAQQVEEGKRKSKSRVTPSYPDLARKLNITGHVKIEVVIAPDGHVKGSRAIGGHPLLVQPCLEAIKEWRFEPAPEETTQIVEFNFGAQQ